jgi:hypothetical protein
MKKVIFASIAALSLIGLPLTQPVSASGDDFNTVWMKWLEFNNWDKEAAYQVMDQMREKIRQEFPMDPKLQQTINDLATQHWADMDAIAKQYGFQNYKEASGSNNEEVVMILKKMEADYSQQNSQLTSAYYEEFNRRYDAACLETMKRLMENANAMSK